MKRKCRLADMVVRRHLSFCLFLPSKNSPAPYLTMKLIEWLHRLRTNNNLERIMKAIRHPIQVVGSSPDGESAMIWSELGSGILARQNEGLKPQEIENIHEAIIQEIAATTECSFRGITRERAVKRKIKTWNIKQDFSSKTAPHDCLIT